ncbi:hypothetical protein CAEBREN_22057 [Caenorhabditis brenneri]|uniref:Uncharacterized protein n=1 Tax=Caenorhabditis brenneri TaxID=135651 RepID=G0P657_CAEBE|nr:hypothetical protein CAEBREN_22057 [Caenorhabditis brenneri]
MTKLAALLFEVSRYFPTFLSYVMLLRLWFLDLRVHIITIYFYCTHSIFGSKKKCVKVSTSQLRRT